MFSRKAVQMDALISGFVKDINEGLYLGILKASSSDGCSISGFVKDINEGLYLGVLKTSSSDGCSYLRVCQGY